MALTPAQLATLKTNFAANTATVSYGGQAVQVNALPNNSDANLAAAAWYNLAASPAFTVWRDLPMEDVLNLITFANMTPLDAVPTTPQLTVTVYQARAAACTCKQINLQNLTLSRTVAPMKKTGYRAALQDCLTNIPAGAAGALLAANWVGVRDGAKFSATNAEKLYATGNGQAATPSDLTHEGPITADDIQNARNLP
jgi:hypothetical protein